MAKLSTHVLNSAHGKPAENVAVSLYRLDGDQKHLITTRHTNRDGRCDQPLLEGSELRAACYELDFWVGDYFKQFDSVATGQSLPFLDRITLRFSISDATQNYHVPLVVTPWSYSTYRGS